MPSPLLKFHVLPDGYTEATDSDIQFREDDELLPLVDKQVILANAVTLVGVNQVDNVDAVPIDTAATRQVLNLSPLNGLTQTATTATTAMAWIFDASSPYALLILRADNSVVPPSEYTITNSGVVFNDTPSTLRKISFFPKASTPRTTWALPYQNTYNGTNSSFNRLIVSVNSGAPILVTPSGTNRSYITTSSATSVKVSYWYLSPVSKNFIGAHPNWLAQHMNTWPDIFVGVKDYPGDSGIVNGQPVTQNEVPMYRDPGTYTPVYRDGLIIFPEDIDSVATPVKANYAYLAGTINVTSQKLDATDGTNLHFHADSEQVYTDTHGNRLITRSNQYMPFNVYVNGQLAPQRLNVSPYETLTIKTGP